MNVTFVTVASVVLTVVRALVSVRTRPTVTFAQPFGSRTERPAFFVMEGLDLLSGLDLLLVLSLDLFSLLLLDPILTPMLLPILRLTPLPPSLLLLDTALELLVA